MRGPSGISLLGNFQKIKNWPKAIIGKNYKLKKKKIKLNYKIIK